MFVDLPRNTSSGIRRIELLPGLFLVVFSFLLLYTLGNACGAETQQSPTAKVPSAPETLFVQFHDLPGVQFAGYIAALENGYYADEGLEEVEFLWQNNRELPLKMLANNQVHFATSWMAEGILARSQGASIIATSLMTQETSSCIMIRKDLFRDLKTVSSLEGKEVSVWFRNETSGQAFLAKHKVNASVVVQRRETCQLFSLGYIHAMIATTWNNQPRVNYLLYRNSILYILFKECGCDYPEDTLFCNETFLERYPELCKKFVKATFRGWLKVMEEPDSVIKLLANRCSEFGMNNDAFVLRKQLDAYLTVFQPDPQKPNHGQCDQARFERLADDLVSGGFIAKAKRPEFHDFFVPVLDQDSVSGTQNAVQTKQQRQVQGTNEK